MKLFIKGSFVYVYLVGKKLVLVFLLLFD